MTQELPRLLTIDELAHVCRYSVTQLRRLVKAGKIECLQPAGRGGRLLFRADCLDRALPTATAQEHPNASEESRRPLPGPTPKWRRRATSA